MTATSTLRLADREQALEHAAALVLDSWRDFDRARPSQPEPTDRHRALLDEPLPESGEAATEALDLAAELLDASFSPARPRWFAYVGSSGLEIGVLADALAATHDVNVAIEAGGADLVERQAIDWTAGFTGFGPADGLLAPGGTISNLTALTAARERALPGIRRDGASGRRMALYCSAEAHHSVVRAAEVLGIGSANVRAIALDGERRIDPVACGQAIAADRRAGIVPVAVVATAGTTLTGAVDDLDALADVCAEQEVWLHVDGAYGLPAAGTAFAGARFAGLERADSATVDAHKWLYVPKACSVLLVRDGTALEAAFAHREAYIPHRAVEHLHPVDRTLEYSRPLRALKLWLAFRVHGATAIREAIERNLRQTRLLAELVDAHPSLEALHEPQLSALCFRHRACAGPEGYHRSAAAAERTLALADLIRRDGRILLAAAEVDGVPCLRACIVNHRTTNDDVHALVEVVDELAGRLPAQPPRS
jgi:aromatic-L-amino-acid decarboxylase